MENAHPTPEVDGGIKRDKQWSFIVLGKRTRAPALTNCM